jgi:hypothetical protein
MTKNTQQNRRRDKLVLSGTAFNFHSKQAQLLILPASLRFFAAAFVLAERTMNNMQLCLMRHRNN